MELLHNQRVVDLTKLPYPPSTWPDPDSCKDFAEWLRGLKEFGGVSQRTIAEVAGSTPQAVTKWLKGGSIEVERLARLAEWSGYPYQKLRRLVDDPKIGILPNNVMQLRPNYGAQSPADKGFGELGEAWRKLSSDNRQQLLGMAKFLLSKQTRRK